MKLIVLPGLDGDAAIRQPLRDALAAHFLTEIIDYPKTLFAYSDMLGFVEPRLPRDDFILIAESYGGPLAIQLAARQPPGLRGMIFAATFARPPRPVPRLLLALLKYMPVHSGWGERLVFRFTGRGHLTRDQITAFITVAKALPAATIRGRLREVLSTDVRAQLSGITVPMACVQPDDDMLVARRAGRDFVAAGARLIKAPGSHYLLEESPEIAARHLLDAIAPLAR